MMARADHMPDIVGGEMTPPTGDKLDVIQVLRGVAALMVTAYHSVGYQMSSKEPGFTHLIAQVGASGVDLFFMISGFIMVYATKRSPGGASETVEFLIKRLARIWPVYAVATLIYLPMMYLLGWYVGHVDVMTEPYKIVRSLLMIPTNFAEGGPYFGGAALHVGWTLSYEVLFYILFAASMLFGRGRWMALTIIAGGLLIAMPFAVSTPSLNAYVHYGFGGKMDFLTSPMLWEFFTGVVIGKIYLTRFTIPLLPATLLSLFSVLFVAWFLGNDISSRMGYTGWAGPYALMLFALTIGSKTMTVKWPKSLIWIGNISFSLYLVHPFIIHPVYQIMWEHVIPGAIMNDLLFVLLLTVASMGLAAVSYRYLEAGLSEVIRKKALSMFRSRHIAAPLETVTLDHS